jgi:hypothetical protein
MQTEARETIRIQDIRPGQHLHPGAVHHTDKFYLLLVYHACQRDIILGSGLETEIICGIPLGADMGRHVLEAWIVAECGIIQERAAPQHGQCRALPRPMVLKARKQRRGFLGTESLQHHAGQRTQARRTGQALARRTLHEGLDAPWAYLLFARRARLEDPMEMLDAVLSCI